MRFLPHLLAALLATTTLTTSVAHACGDYVQVDPAPRVLAVSTHGLFEHGRWTQRAFVVLEDSIALDADAPWKLLAPGTYDATRILAMSALAKPLEVTLVGPSGTRVVKTSKQVGLTGSFHIGWRETRVALEVPVKANQQLAIAIVGRAPDATWREIDYSEATAATTWWLHQQGIKDVEYVALRGIHGTDLDIVEFSQNGTSRFIVRRGGEQVGVAADATPVGAVTTAGRSFVVFKTNGRLGLLELPKLASA